MRKEYKKKPKRTQKVSFRAPVKGLEQLDGLAVRLGVTRSQAITELLFKKHRERWERYEITIEGQKDIKAVHACLSEVSQLLLRKTQELKPERISLAKCVEVGDIMKRLYELISDLQKMVKKRA
jgi:hypothetical protein